MGGIFIASFYINNMTERIVHLYIHKNLTNGKCYIGQTVGTFKGRWGYRGNGYKENEHFYSAIQKYGWEGFSHESLGDVCEAIADFMESHYITFYDSMNPSRGYNHTTGGNLHKRASEETKKKLFNIRKGSHLSEETKKKLSESITGKFVSEETRKKQSEALKGRVFTEAWKSKISQSLRNESVNSKLGYWRGKNLPDDTKKKISESRKGKTAGDKNPFYGHHWSEEAKKKQSEMKLGKGLGDKNPNSKIYKIRDPEGNEFEVNCLASWCEKTFDNPKSAYSNLVTNYKRYRGYKNIT